VRSLDGALARRKTRRGTSPPPLSPAAETSLPAALGELDRVLHEVPYDLLDSRGIAVDVVALGAELDRKRDRLGVGVVAADLDRVIDEAVKVDDLERELELSSRDAAQVEQVVDEAPLELDVALDHFEHRDRLPPVGAPRASAAETAARTGVSGVRSACERTARKSSLARIAS
jgi:hypothetical protein